MEKQVLDQAILESIKKELLGKKSSLEKELKSYSRQDYHETDNRSAKFPEYGDKPDENAQEISEYTATVAAQKILENDLEDVESALKRILDGKYGICKYCQNEISPKRLMARPTASSCIDCKTELQNDV